jgi:hypothetical protein
LINGQTMNSKFSVKTKRCLQAGITVITGAILFTVISPYIDTPDPFDAVLFYWSIIVSTVILGFFAGWVSDIPVYLWWVSLSLGVLIMVMGNLWPFTFILLLVVLAPSTLVLYLSRILRNQLMRNSA